MGPPKGKDADLAQQDVLQAVVLADSFAAHFRPITFEMPKVLMPLANLPMIEYTLEFLAAGGVQEVFIFCCAHAEEVEKYIASSQLEQRLATVKVHVLVATGACTSAGDALREVEARGVIKSDFVLVPGDVVANLSLAPLIAAHKARREIDREAVLTTVLARVPLSHRARRAGEAKLVALKGETGRLIMYDDVRRRDWQHKVRLPMGLLQESDKLLLHADLYDTHIDVCTPDFLALLQDNFDWQDLRRDAIPGILGQFEMLGKTIYTQVLANDSYAARVHDPHTYDVVSRDIIQRWAFPLVPDANLLPGTTYRHSGHCVYREAGVTLARSSSLVRNCVVGGGTTIGERTTVEDSVIGPNCKIGQGVTIVGSYLWGNVTVADGASLHGCICCDHVNVESGAMVAPGCVLGQRVKVGASRGLPRYARFWAPDADTSARAAEEEADDEEEEEDEEEDGDDMENSRRSEGARTKAATEEALSKGGGAALLGSSDGTLWKVVPAAVSMGFERSRDVWEGPVPGEESEEEEEEMEALEDAEADGELAFATEVGDTVKRAMASDHTVDNLALEINSLKFAQNRTFADCVRAMVPALLGEPSLSTGSKKERVAVLKKMAKRWLKPLLARFIQSNADRSALLESSVSACAPSEALLENFEQLLHLLYDDDLLPEETILGWAEEAEGADEGDDEKKCFDSAKNMIDWLRSDDDDEEDDEEDD